jgi:actin-like protein 6A
MYGGDEINALVLDVGTHTTRAGFAGEDTPKCAFPTTVAVTYFKEKGNENVVGSGPRPIGESDQKTSGADSNKLKTPENVVYHVGETALYRRDYTEMQNPLENGLIVNWDIIEKIWEHAVHERLHSDAKEHPILMSEVSYNTPTHREKITEIMFEKFEVPAFFLVKNAVLTAFAYGKSSGLVLDTGHVHTVVTPVHEGFALQKAIMKTGVAGHELNQLLLRLLKEKDPQLVIRPNYLLSKKETKPGQFEVHVKELPNTTQSYHNFMVQRIIEDIKEVTCSVPDTGFDLNLQQNVTSVPYELPDGRILQIGAERFIVPEVLFNPTVLGTNYLREVGQARVGLSQLIYNSLNTTDFDIRTQLFGAVMLCGGTSLLRGFYERIQKELSLILPDKARLKVLCPVPIERKFSSWIGGSILASLGSFHQMWISKQEYDEFGKTIVNKKCP